MSAAKWLTFTHERFHPPTHAAMIGFFVWVHGALGPSGLDWHHYLAAAVGVTAFFFKLRLYDEIKDYELDLVLNPTRPLARGLVSHQDLHRGIFVCLVLELGCFASLGWGAFTGMAFAAGYSLIMYNEFFLKELIRPHLTTYAVIHTVSSGFLSLAIFSGLRNLPPWELTADDVKFSAACWCVFNVFEFARKTFATREERDGVESYSKVWTRPGAVALVVAMVVIADALLLTHAQVRGTAANVFYGLLLVAVAASGGCYVLRNTEATAKLYRGVASVYIILTLAGAVILDFLK